jgi:hypothetical protein
MCGCFRYTVLFARGAQVEDGLVLFSIVRALVPDGKAFVFFLPANFVVQSVSLFKKTAY